MKYIITENQQKRMLKHLKNVLNQSTENVDAICKINVIEVTEDDDEYKDGLRYDIFVYLSKRWTNVGGWYGFNIATTRRLQQILTDWLGLTEDEYSISTLVEDC